MNVAVIGSGVAGLAASIRLAHRGHSVTVFEANSYPGGKLTTVEKDGFKWDAGPSLFTMPDLVDEVLNLAEPLTENTFVYRKMSESCRYFWEDGTEVTAHENRRTFANEIEEKIGVKSFRVMNALRDSEQTYNAVSPLFLEKSLHKIPNLLNGNLIKLMSSFPKLNLHKTMHSVNKTRFKNQKLIQLFDRFATYNGSSPYKASGIMNVIPHLEHNIGTFLPEGGMYAITESLVQAAKSLGVEIQLNSPVKKIETSDKTVTGIVVNDTFKAFDAVVSNMDIVPTYRNLLPEQFADDAVLNQERSSSALIFYWGVKGNSEKLGLHNILFSDKYEEEFKALFETRALIDDPTVYINITSKYLKGQAPEGHENWFVMVNAPANTGQDWDAMIEKTRQNVIQKVERVLGFELSGNICCEEILDPRSIELKTGSYMGSLYGTSSNHWKSAFLRHPNFKQDIKKLYFCGGSVHPGGGIPLCLLSAKIVDELIAV